MKQSKNNTNSVSNDQEQTDNNYEVIEKRFEGGNQTVYDLVEDKNSKKWLRAEIGRRSYDVTKNQADNYVKNTEKKCKYTLPKAIKSNNYLYIEYFDNAELLENCKENYTEQEIKEILKEHYKIILIDLYGEIDILNNHPKYFDDFDFDKEEIKYW